MKGRVMIKIALAFVMMVLASACTDARSASWSAYGERGHIKCFSGGKLIYDGVSTGRISTVQHSDGWEFKDSKTGRFVRISGDCLIEN